VSSLIAPALRTILEGRSGDVKIAYLEFGGDYPE